MYANCYYITGSYDKALALYKSTLHFFEQNGLNAELVKKEIADVYFEKGDPQKAAELYRKLAEEKEKIKKERFYAQLNELRNIVLIDKIYLTSNLTQDDLDHCCCDSYRSSLIKNII
jgi:tetratricopeptide (TPR) repeat protein